MEKLEITLYAEGEKIMLEVPPGTTVGQLVEHARTLQGKTAAFRVNGAAVAQTTPLRQGDRVAAVPQSGQLA